MWLELGKVLFGISCQIGCINNSYNNRLDLSDNNQFMSSGPCNQHSVSSNKFHHKNKIFEKQQKHTNQTKIFKEVFSGSVMRFSYLKKRCQITRLSIIHKKRICSQKWHEKLYQRKNVFYAKTNFLNFFDNLIQCARIYGNIRHVLHVWHKSVPTSNSLFMSSKKQNHEFTNTRI